MSRSKIPSAEALAEEEEQYGPLRRVEDLDEKYPNRPHNHSRSLPFHELYLNLFNPLAENNKRPKNQISRKTGIRAPVNPHEMRHRIISRFIDRWRAQVGDDFYPAMRLIIPDKDRDRAMYGIKEKTIGKLLVRVMGLNKASEDAESLVNWRLPGKYSSAAGDFGARCYEVIKKRPMLNGPGNLTVGQVNVLLDQLSVVSKEDEQMPIFAKFYNEMNADELKWLIRIILRQMKVGATEKTILSAWHPSAESLFNISSSLKRVCWELSDPAVQLEDSELKIMDCFQPQLAAFKMHSFEKIVSRMDMTADDKEFWIEEKLDGERMQLHAQENPAVAGGMEFRFWSRKAKDYTYLYGTSFEDAGSALTKHLRGVFTPGVRSIVLDGEMVVWNLLVDKIDGFGHLKTHAIEAQVHGQSDKRPMYRVFDCLYLNGKALTRFSLRDRRNALQQSVREIRRRLEIHPYEAASGPEAIERALDKVILDGAEGLVVKNPRSRYWLGARNDDWIKVKPDYMAEFGEEFDVIVIGGFYGQGSRGGFMASFLCGVPLGDAANPQKCLTFCKVGGGFSGDDYKKMQGLTAGKWHKYDSRRPPDDWIVQGASPKPEERPHEWIKPEDSVVLSIKASQLLYNVTNYATNCTPRFPRLREIRVDKGWTDALTLQGLQDLAKGVRKREQEKQFRLDDERRQKRKAVKARKPLVLAGAEGGVGFVKQEGQGSDLFAGLTFFVLSGSGAPERKTKAELEGLVKAHGGKIVQAYKGTGQIVVISETRNLKALSILKAGKLNIVRPLWLFDCIYQSRVDDGQPRFLLPFQPNHMFHTVPSDEEMIAANVDEFGDSYCRDVNVESLRKICDSMKDPTRPFDKRSFMSQLEHSGVDLSELPGNMFQRFSVYFDRPDTDLDMGFAVELVKLGGGTVVSSADNIITTHVVVGRDAARLSEVRSAVSRQHPIPRIVDVNWVLGSWREKTILGEERFPPM